MSKAIETLKAARAIIAKPEHWTRLIYARDAHDISRPFNSDLACKFCIEGAIKRAALQLGDDGDEVGAFSTLEVLTAPASLAQYNDDRNHYHGDILALLDRAIAPLPDSAFEDEDDTACTSCGAPADNGEGYNGLCGTCADRAEG